jgi:hypothetical protein
MVAESGWDKEAGTKAAFGQLSSQFPGLGKHFEALEKQGVKVELVKGDSLATTGAYFFTPKKGEEGSPAIRVSIDKPLTQAALNDNVHFESFNAAVAKDYAALDTKLRSGRISPTDYGVEKARIEQGVTTRYIDSVLSQFQGEGKATARAKLNYLARQVPEDLSTPEARKHQDTLTLEAKSLGLTEKALRAVAWAEKQSPGYIDHPDPLKHGTFMDAFLAAPHEKGADATDRGSLPSGDLYAFEKLGGMSDLAIRGALKSAIPGPERNENWAGPLIKTLESMAPKTALPDISDQSQEAMMTRVRVYHNALKEVPKLIEAFKEEGLPEETGKHIQALFDGFQLPPAVKEFMRRNDPHFVP